MAFPVNIQEPDEMDISSDTVIYKGWKMTDSGNYTIEKMTISDVAISRKYAVGAWADRTTLTYE